jgi:hypothetical protein
MYAWIFKVASSQTSRPCISYSAIFPTCLVVHDLISLINNKWAVFFVITGIKIFNVSWMIG